MLERKKRILIAEDEINLLKSMSFTLRRKGFEVVEVSSGSQALKAVKDSDKFYFDLIISDIQMPGLTGTEFISEIRNITSTPILAVSGFGDKKLILELMRIGCDDFLDKPFEMNEFLERINKLIKNNRGVEKWKKILLF